MNNYENCIWSVKTRKQYGTWFINMDQQAAMRALVVFMEDEESKP